MASVLRRGSFPGPRPVPRSPYCHPWSGSGRCRPPGRRKRVKRPPPPKRVSLPPLPNRGVVAIGADEVSRCRNPPQNDFGGSRPKRFVLARLAAKAWLAVRARRPDSRCACDSRPRRCPAAADHCVAAGPRRHPSLSLPAVCRSAESLPLPTKKFCRQHHYPPRVCHCPSPPKEPSCFLRKFHDNSRQAIITSAARRAKFHLRWRVRVSFALPPPPVSKNRAVAPPDHRCRFSACHR